MAYGAGLNYRDAVCLVHPTCRAQVGTLPTLLIVNTALGCFPFYFEGTFLLLLVPLEIVLKHVKILGTCPEMDGSQADGVRMPLFAHLFCSKEEPWDTRHSKWRVVLGIKRG